jgi:hypothetical protein
MCRTTSTLALAASQNLSSSYQNIQLQFLICSSSVHHYELHPTFITKTQNHLTLSISSTTKKPVSTQKGADDSVTLGKSDFTYVAPEPFRLKTNISNA